MYLSTLTLLHSIKAESGEATAEEKFQANRGWVMKLKGRNPLHNIKIQVKWNEVLAAQLCPTLHNLLDCSLPGSSVHGILQVRILVWVAISFSRVSFPPRNQTTLYCIAGIFFTIWAMANTNVEVATSFPEDLTKIMNVAVLNNRCSL